MTVAENPNEKQMTAPEYIRANFHPSDRIAVVVRKRGRGETIQRITTADRVAASSFQDWLHFKNEKDNCDVYIGMNALKSESHTRTRDDIQAIRHLYLELDHDGSQLLEAIEKSTELPKPSYVIETAPDQFQAIWKVVEITTQQAEALLHAMAARFESDPAAVDATTVLRLPGFLNKKLEEDFLVRVHQQTSLTYHRRDFKLAIEPLEAGLQRMHQSQDRLATTPKQGLAPTTSVAGLVSPDLDAESQSELDQIYAKRALARGDAPEHILRNIAEFRAYHKPNPHNYAHQILTKAQAELRPGAVQDVGGNPIHTGEFSHEQ